MPVQVLLVDDVPETRIVLRTALKHRGGFEVVAEADTGAQAIDRAGALRPQVVVLDLGLPDLAGHHVLSGIREVSPDSKIVLYTGGEEPRDDWADEAAGYVRKGGDLDVLLEMLETLTDDVAANAGLELPHDMASVRLARRFVADTIREWHLSELLDDVLLATSELATNALTHARSACSIQVSRTRSSLRVDVFDEGAGTPEPRPLTSNREHGRGLHLVDAVATAWGLENVADNGKVVWAEFAIRN